MYVVESIVITKAFFRGTLQSAFLPVQRNAKKVLPPERAEELAVKKGTQFVFTDCGPFSGNPNTQLNSRKFTG